MNRLHLKFTDPSSASYYVANVSTDTKELTPEALESLIEQGKGSARETYNLGTDTELLLETLQWDDEPEPLA